MTYTILFVATVVVVSGLIAYLGDLIGRRMGKRRLTLFGLRPRHTAIVMTTITGMVIASLTIGTMLGTSSRLRHMFLRGERLVREIETYQIKNRQLRQRNVELSEASERLTEDVRKKSLQVKKAEKEVVEARKQASAATRARDQVLVRVKNLQSEVRSRQVELAKLRQTGRLTEQQLRQTSASLDERVAELLAVKKSLAEQDMNLAAKQRELDARSQELASKVAQLEEAESQLREAEIAVRHQRELIEAQKRLLTEEMMRTEMLLVGDVVLQQGQEIGRRVIDSTLSKDQVRAELARLLDNASDVAEESQAGSGRASRAVQLVFLDRRGRNIVDDEDACIDKAAEAIVAQGKQSSVKSVIVRVIVVSNTLKGNNALVEFGPFFWNKLAFRRGENIARRVIDGRMSEGRVLLAVMDFLKENVRSAAQQEGVVPVAGPDPDRAAEPISDRQLDHLMDLVEMIRSTGKRVELRAVAESDIYAAGPLDLDSIGFAVSTLASASK